jgi:hypothetical protein
MQVAGKGCVRAKKSSKNARIFFEADSKAAAGHQKRHKTESIAGADWQSKFDSNILISIG